MSENQKKVFTEESLSTFVEEIKTYINNSVNDVAIKVEFITVEDIDTICGTTYYTSETGVF